MSFQSHLLQNTKDDILTKKNVLIYTMKINIVWTNCWNILQNSFVFHRKKKVIQVWKRWKWVTDFIFGRTIASNKIPDLFAGKLLTTAWNSVGNSTFDTFCPELEPLERISQGSGKSYWSGLCVQDKPAIEGQIRLRIILSLHAEPVSAKCISYTSLSSSTSWAPVQPRGLQLEPFTETEMFLLLFV